MLDDPNYYDPIDSVNGTHQYESIDVDEFILDRENQWKHHMYHQERMGRYPHGYRHFENFANYSQHKPDATIQEYIEVMNSPCEFSEYLAIMRQHMVEEAESPEALHEEKAKMLE